MGFLPLPPEVLSTGISRSACKYLDWDKKRTAYAGPSSANTGSSTVVQNQHAPALSPSTRTQHTNRPGRLCNAIARASAERAVQYQCMCRCRLQRLARPPTHAPHPPLAEDFGGVLTAERRNDHGRQTSHRRSRALWPCCPPAPRAESACCSARPLAVRSRCPLKRHCRGSHLGCLETRRGWGAAAGSASQDARLQACPGVRTRVSFPLHPRSVHPTFKPRVVSSFKVRRKVEKSFLWGTEFFFFKSAREICHEL